MAKKNENNPADEQPELSEAEVASDQEVVPDIATDNLQQQLDQALEERQKLQEQLLRTLAEMDNLRKRTLREKEEMGRFANENILREILPVVDNLERAVEHVEKAESADGLLEGVRMTLTQFGQVLKRFGVEPIDAVGQPFDPSFHQAMGQLESQEHAVNTVVSELQKGYQLNERLLRPSFVLLAKTPETDEDL